MATAWARSALLDKGTIISGYRVDGTLGEGGMGIVYRATQLSLNRTVALKILAAELSADRAFRERFRREGLLQAAIDHEHIVTVYEAGESEHGLFLAMRLIRGPTLKDMVIARELNPMRGLGILRQVANALDTAHEVGLTHRDIKPQNILIGARDHAYLADFGLTQAGGDASLTETGQFIGTIDYVAPEQVQGEPATPRSDVYSLTGVLYECMTGTVPYPKPNEPAVLYAHISEPPPRPTERRGDLPGALDEVVARGMAKLPSDRYGSAGELVADALAAFGDGATAVTPPGPIQSAAEAGLHDPGKATVPAVAPAGARTAARAVQPAPVHAGATTARAGAPLGGAAAATAPAGAAASATPAAHASPLPAAPPAPAARRGLRGPLLALVVALGVAAAVAGFLAAGGGEEPAQEEEAFTSSASAGTVELSFPSTWERVSEEPQLPGVKLTEPIVLMPREFPRARLQAGQVAADGPELLSSGLLERLPDPPPEGEPVRLGDLEGLRYPRLQPRGLEGVMRLYAVPTTAGVATVACTAPGPQADAFLRDCEAVATTLQLTGAEPYPLGPNPAYARRLGRVFDRLDSVRVPGVAKMRRAGTPDAQAEAADALARAYIGASRAAADIEVSPADGAAHEALAAALQRIGFAYDRAAEAARASNGPGYSAAGRSVQAGERALRRALAELEQLGYSVS
jgi:hypothetical protein